VIPYHQNEKGKPDEMDLPLLKNDIQKIIGSIDYKPKP
jgi:hypothetical protein